MIELKDRLNLKDQLILNSKDLTESKGGVSKTRIIISDHDTGEVLQDLTNRILVPGSQVNACKQFGISPAVVFPSYNKELQLENSLEPYPTILPRNEPITCLWCAGQSGYANGQVLVPSNTDRIDPAHTVYTTNIEKYIDIVPFRYCTPGEDLTNDQRQVYFGRKVTGDATENERIIYFFKAFDTVPQLHVRYLDGTEVTDNMYNIDSSQLVETYVEMRLTITRTDFREYFDQVIGWDNAYINTISLLTAWYDDSIPENPEDSEENRIYYKWYQDVIPFSKFNFENESFKNLNRSLDFNYQVYY